MKVYDKRGLIQFIFLTLIASNIRLLPAHGVYTTQLVRIDNSISSQRFNRRNKLLTHRLYAKVMNTMDFARLSRCLVCRYSKFHSSIKSLSTEDIQLPVIARNGLT